MHFISGWSWRHNKMKQQPAFDSLKDRLYYQKEPLHRQSWEIRLKFLFCPLGWSMMHAPELNGLQVGTPTVSFFAGDFMILQHTTWWILEYPELWICTFFFFLFPLEWNPSGRAVKMWFLNKIFFYCANNSHILHISLLYSGSVGYIHFS